MSITRQRAIEIGFPKEWITEKTLQGEDEESLKTQWCEDCGKIITVHPDARWRLQITAIRCNSCADKLIAQGVDRFDAFFTL